jgi:hypothetical protein
MAVAETGIGVDCYQAWCRACERLELLRAAIVASASGSGPRVTCLSFSAQGLPVTDYRQLRGEPRNPMCDMFACAGCPWKEAFGACSLAGSAWDRLYEVLVVQRDAQGALAQLDGMLARARQARDAARR